MEDENRQVKTLAPHIKVKALVVDDEEVNRILLSDAMQAIGVQVRVAANGQEAMERIGEDSPDIIFLDLRMPVMDGIETLNCINEKYGYGRFQIVGTSATDSNLQKNEFLQKGCDTLVAKPFRLSQIFDCLKKLLGAEFVYRDNGGATPQSPSTSDAIDFPSIRVPAEQFLAILDAVEKRDASGVKRMVADLKLEGDDEGRLAMLLSTLTENKNLEMILETLEKCPIAGIGHD